MLSRLIVQNYAIISSLEVSFSGRLNIITGETGAGKSILAGALGMVLGDRADSSVIRDASRKMVVEAVFAAAHLPSLASLLSAWDIDPSEELILRRELSANGKSRSFVNDTPVNLSQLQSISATLVDMHQQFDTLDLGRDDFQRAVLDAFCGHEEILRNYTQAYQEYVQVRKKLEDLKAEVERGSRDLDFQRFIYEELRDAAWQENELESLEAELKLLSHAEQIRNTLTRICFDLSESEQPLVQQLKSMLNQLQALGEVHSAIPGLSARMQSVYLELRDVSGDLQHLGDQVQADPARMDEISARIALGQRLMKKHGVRTSQELVEVQESLRQKLQVLTHSEEALQEMEKQVSKAMDRAIAQARKISAGRVGKAAELSERIASLLQRVGMPNASLKVEMQEATLYEGGLEQVRFMFDANRSQRYEPLNKVASGGELSRLMLVIKSLIAGSADMPTLIFDEIDSGISGEAARQVGILMQELSQRHQVLSITHQPQIAARADAHFHVYKEETEGMIQTRIRVLDESDRIQALARMMGGERPSAVVIENAKELIAEGKSGSKPPVKPKPSSRSKA